jgi:hypothetical protein
MYKSYVIRVVFYILQLVGGGVQSRITILTASSPKIDIKELMISRPGYFFDALHLVIFT